MYGVDPAPKMESVHAIGAGNSVWIRYPLKMLLVPLQKDCLHEMVLDTFI